MSEICRAEPADLPALLDIYNYYVRETPVNFDIAPRTLAQREEWLAQFSAAGKYQCFAAHEDGRAVGYACSMPFKEKAAYATTIETSIYCAPDSGGKGIGRRLYETLFEAIKGEDIHRAFAGITLPNEGSVRIHEAFGFRHIGTYTEVGRKFGKYWDVGLYMKDMGRPFGPPGQAPSPAQKPLLYGPPPGAHLHNKVNGGARAWRNW